jgi:UDP-arabinose 4-epimerase
MKSRGQKGNILVVGGAGYIGSHAAKALAKAGYTPVTYDNLTGGNEWAVRWGPLVRGDLADRAKLVESIRTFRVSGVLHFAALTNVADSMNDPGIYFRNNVAGTLTLLEAMREAGIGNLVFSSTCATYGMPERLPITEDTPQRPINAYGESKLMVERMLHWWDAAYGLRYVTLRYFNAAGADPEGEIGDCHHPETHLIPLALEAVLGRRQQINIYGADYPTSDGSAIRDYVHVEDLADAHVLSLGFLLQGGASASFNLGSGNGHSVYQVIMEIERVTGSPVPRRIVGRRVGDPPILIADLSRAQQMLHWEPHCSDINSIVATAWEWRSRHWPRISKGVALDRSPRAPIST